MREYDGETLRKLQRYELQILKDFVKICEENALTYFGFAGTGIGALRHGGFIPWDDDIDIAIPREDYDRLIEVIRRDYADRYYILDAETYDDYPLMTTRICLKDSMFVEHPFKHLKCPLGIFLDVYPFDTPPMDEKERKRCRNKAWIVSKLLILKHCPFPAIHFRGLLGKLTHAATWSVWFLMKIFGVSHRFLYRRAVAYGQKHNGEESDAYDYYYSQVLGAGYRLKSDIFPLRKLPFEDIEICFMNELEKELTRNFGDYMQLPPPEKRKNHFPYVLKFPGEAPIQGDETT